jgi:hypothetical protein
MVQQHTTPKHWIKVPGACQTISCRESRLYELLANLAEEDPEGIIETFIFKSEGAARGTRLFEEGSLHRYMQWKYEKSQAERKRREEEHGKCPVVR